MLQRLSEWRFSVAVAGQTLIVMALLAGCLWLCLRVLDWALSGPAAGGAQRHPALVESTYCTVEGYRGLEEIRMARSQSGPPLLPDAAAVLDVAEARLRLLIAVTENDGRHLGRAIAALDRAGVYRNRVDHPQHWAADQLLRDDIAMVRALAGVDETAGAAADAGPLASVP